MKYFKSPTLFGAYSKNRRATHVALLGITAMTLASTLPGCNPSNSGGPLSGDQPGTSAPTTQDKIVFERQGAIWIMNPDGTEKRNLNVPGTQPVLSTDGRIAFIRNQQLWTVNSDGANPQQRTQSGSGDFLKFQDVTDPDWRPDNEEIAIAGQQRDGFYSIYTVILRDNSIVRYTGLADNPNTALPDPPNNGTDAVVGFEERTRTQANDFDPGWSPDGRQIVFVTDRHYIERAGAVSPIRPRAELYRLTFSPSFGGGVTQTRLTASGFVDSGSSASLNGSKDANGGQAGNPVWSPDGATIVWNVITDGSVFNLFQVPANGQNVTASQMRQITTAGGRFPDFAPSGVQLVCDGAGSAMTGIFTMGAQGSRRVIRRDELGVTPSWGTVIVAAPTPTPRPTSTPVPTPTPPSSPFACTGSESTVNAQTSFNLTVKRLANGSTQGFQGIIEAGDHEANGDGTVQGYFGFPISQLPAANQISSVRLQLVENLAERVGNPFSGLGNLFVEPVDSPGNLNEGAALPNSATLSRSGTNFEGVVTNAVKQAKSQNKDFIFFRVRFQQLHNNNGQIDIVDFNQQPKLIVCRN